MGIQESERRVTPQPQRSPWHHLATLHPGGAWCRLESGFVFFLFSCHPVFIDFPPPAPDLSAPAAPSLPAGRVGGGTARCKRWAVVPVLAQVVANCLSEQPPFLFLWQVAGRGAAVGSYRRGRVAGIQKNTPTIKPAPNPLGWKSEPPPTVWKAPHPHLRAQRAAKAPQAPRGRGWVAGNQKNEPTLKLPPNPA